MEDYLGRRLVDGETVHHIDFDKDDNSVENLHLFDSRSAHRKAHASLETLGAALFERGIIYFDQLEGVYKLCGTKE